MQCSVVLTYANDAPFLGDMLDSLERQTLRQIEVIAVDNGSVDESSGLVAAKCASDPRFRRLVHKGDALGGARNAGAAVASGPYILFAEGNDMLSLDALERLLGAAKRHVSDVTVCAFEYVQKTENHYHNGFHTSATGLTGRDDTNSQPLSTTGHTLVSDLLAMPCNKLFRRDFLETHGIRFEADGFYEEHAFWFDVAEAVPRLSYTGDALYRIRDEPEARQLWTGGGHAFDAVKALRALARRLQRAEDHPLLAKLCVRLAWERLTFALTLPEVRAAFIDACLEIVSGVDPVLLQTERDEYVPASFVSDMISHGSAAFASATWGSDGWSIVRA